MVFKKWRQWSDRNFGEGKLKSISGNLKVQFELLFQFKAMVTEVVPESFMKDDPYLLRLLKGK